jgi:hypothetical protein
MAILAAAGFDERLKLSSTVPLIQIKMRYHSLAPAPADCNPSPFDARNEHVYRPVAIFIRQL